MVKLFEAALAVTVLAAVTECAVYKCVDNFLNLVALVVDSLGAVGVCSLKLVNLFNSCTEDVFVLFACFLCNLNVSTVICRR